MWVSVGWGWNVGGSRVWKGAGMWRWLLWGWQMGGKEGPVKMAEVEARTKGRLC